MSDIDVVLLPAGEHQSLECSWGREDVVLTLWCPLMTSDYVDLGTFTAVADADTRFAVDGQPCDMDTALNRYGELWGFTTLHASEPGRLESMEYSTRLRI